MRWEQDKVIPGVTESEEDGSEAQKTAERTKCPV